MRVAGDHWWPATLLLFGPRWLITLPLIVLFALAAWKNRRMLLPLTAALIIIVGPIMGYNLPLGKARPASDHPLRIITCNIQNGKFDLPALNALIENSRPDIVALQECPAELQLKLPPGWQKVEERGLTILSHLPLRRGVTIPVFNPPNPWPVTCLLHCVVTAPTGDLDVCSIHLPTPRFGIQAVLDRTTLLRPSRKGLLLKETAYRERASAEVRRAVAALTRPVIIAGDFNMPVDSAIYRKIWSGYSNCFSRTGFGYGFTQRVTLKGLPVAVRIDHILTGEGLVPRICEVGPDVGSDHLPVIADVARSML